MSNKTILLIAKILGIIFIVWGGVLLFSLLLGGTSLATLITGNAILKESGELPMDVNQGFGQAFMLTLPICIAYFVAAFGLLKLKSWAYIAVAAVGILGLLNGLSNIFSLVWSVAYLGFAYVMFTHKSLFK